MQLWYWSLHAGSVKGKRDKSAKLEKKNGRRYIIHDILFCVETIVGQSNHNNSIWATPSDEALKDIIIIIIPLNMI